MYFVPFLLLFRLQRYAIDARRRDRTWRYLAWSLLAGTVASILIASLVLVAALLVVVGLWWLAALLVAIAGLPLLSPMLVRHVLAPLGWTRAAYWAGHFGTTRDSVGNGLAHAAWAHLRRPSGDGEAWIADRLAKRSLGDAEVVTAGLLAAARGDADGARQLLRSALDLVDYNAAVRELAGEWLACDAAERGAWAELAADGAAARWPATPLVYFLEGVARARTGGAIRAADLYARWILAPQRLATYALLATPRVPAASTPVHNIDDAAPAAAAAALANPAESPLPPAVAAHLALAAKVDARALAAAVAAWDAALAADSTRAWLAHRALELDAPLGAAERALREVTAAVGDELARLADTHMLGAPAAHGPIGGALAHRLRHGRLDALEASFARWGDRRHDGAIRAPIDEWRELVALRAAYDAAVTAGGLGLRRLAFPHAYRIANGMAVWLWNSRKEYALSHAISAWLLAEALAVGDTEAIELCTRNVRLAVPTRNGRVVTTT